MSKSTVGQYEIYEQIGEGGFATVYRAKHARLGTEVALKILKGHATEDEKLRQRFIEEAQAASTLDHPYIVKISNLGQEDGRLFIVMDYVAGDNLREWRQKHGDADWRVMTEILTQVASALDYAHQRKIWHRDVKPSNILIDAENKACLGDFGLVRREEIPHLTQIGQVVGTPEYMSPEQAEGRELDGRSDQYSLASVAYELLVGHTPFQGQSPTTTLMLMLRQSPALPSGESDDVPPEVDKVLLRALDKNPTERYSTCTEFVQELKAASADSEVRRHLALLDVVRAAIADGNYDTARQMLETAAVQLARQPEIKNQVAELEEQLRQAVAYEETIKDWQAARQQARNTLTLMPDYPDEKGIFVALGLRDPVRERPSLPEIARQTAVGLLLGSIGVMILLYLTFLWITRLQ
jgi:serine/threonine-protein kinase